jgi:hypothetical protein
MCDSKISITSLYRSIQVLVTFSCFFYKFILFVVGEVYKGHMVFMFFQMKKNEKMYVIFFC